jgi:hypothetical protein
MNEPSDADALRVLSDRLEERGDDAGARMLREVAGRLDGRPAMIRAVGGIVDKSETILLAGRAMSLFGHAYAEHHRRIGALLEALQLFCEETKRVAPGLWENSCRFAARLTDERRKNDPEWQAELARLRNSVGPWIWDIERGRLMGEDDAR